MNQDADGAVAPLVLHILPEDMARGAQSHARALVDRLDSTDERHRVLTLFRSGPEGLRPDFRLDVPMGRLRHAGFHPAVVLRLRRLLRELAPSVVLAHGGEAAKYAALVKPRTTPLVYLMIGASHPLLTRSFSRSLYRWTLRRCRRVVAVSNQLAGEARDLHDVPAERIVVIPNGRDHRVFRPRAKPRVGPVRLAWVGHMDEAKRPGRFLDLVAALSRNGEVVEAWMAGDGPLFETVSRAASEVGVDLLGTREDVAELLAGSDVLVFTGQPPEGMPGVLIEAGLCGIPVVTTRVPGAEEVVVHGDTGLVVDVDDFEDLVKSVAMLVNDPELRARMGDKARERCIDRFSMDRVVGDWDMLIAGAGTSS